MTETRFPAVRIGLAVALLLTACGGGESNSASVAGDGKAFVPDGIKYEIVEGGRALTLTAATLLEDPAGGQYWVIAARNDEESTICMPEVNAVFATSTNPEDTGAGQSVVSVQGPMYQSDAGPGPCLAPGEVGMGAQPVQRTDGGLARIVDIAYQGRGFITPEATKLPELAVEQVKIVNGATGTSITGNVVNRAASVAPKPELTLFALDSVGRPSDFAYDHSQTDLAPGAAWSFHATAPGPINKYIAFPVYGQQ